MLPWALRRKHNTVAAERHTGRCGNANPKACDRVTYPPHHSENSKRPVAM